jgi:hypothetical protein
MLKNYVFWCVTPFSLIEVNLRFGGTCCLHFLDRCVKNSSTDMCHDRSHVRNSDSKKDEEIKAARQVTVFLQG